MPNFADIASKPIADVERPPLPPVGTYRWSVTKLPTQTKSGDEKWEILTFNLRALQAEDDVDLSGYSGEVTNIQNSRKFMFNTEDEAEFDKTLFQLRQFLENHLKCCGPEDSVAQGINNSVNAQCLGTIAWNQDKNDKEIFYANIARTAPVE